MGICHIYFFFVQALGARKEQKVIQDLMDGLVSKGVKVVLVHQARLEDRDFLGPMGSKVFLVHGDTPETLEIRYTVAILVTT